MKNDEIPSITEMMDDSPPFDGKPNNSDITDDEILDPSSAESITRFREPTGDHFRKISQSNGMFRVSTDCCDETWDVQYVRFLMPWEHRYDMMDEEYADFAFYAALQRSSDDDDVPEIPRLGVIEIRDSGESALFPQLGDTGYHSISGVSEIPSGEDGFLP